jgi:amino acid transporter
MAYVIVAVVAASIVAFFAIIFGTASGMQAADFANGIWLVISFVPWFGLPIGIALIIALVLMNAHRRSRGARNDSH